MPECDTRIRPLAPAAPLVDATPTFDRFVNAAIAAAQPLVNGDDRANSVYMAIGAPATLDPSEHDFNKSGIEVFGDSQAANLVFPPPKSQTKYAGVEFGVWPGGEEHPRTLSPTLLIGEIPIGLDKLGHFAQQGYAYYRMVKRGQKLSDAENWGVQSETGGAQQDGPPFLAAYGLTSTGVFSRADLLANKAGYEFYSWIERKTSTPFSFANFVTADWNEERTTPYYHQDIWRTVWNNLIPGTWAGTFTQPNSPLPIAVTFTLAVNGERISGNYGYTDATGAHAGRMSGALHPFFRYLRGPVGGVTLPWSWTRGTSSGRGLFSSEGTENQLRGSWGFGESFRDGGAMNLTRV